MAQVTSIIRFCNPGGTPLLPSEPLLGLVLVGVARAWPQSGSAAAAPPWPHGAAPPGPAAHATLPPIGKRNRPVCNAYDKELSR